jgi:hypothetical protein
MRADASTYQTTHLCRPGLPDYSWHNTPKRGKIHQITTKLPNAHQIYTTVINYSKYSEYIATFSIPRSSKIYPNWYFWSEKKPSGNPGFQFPLVWLCRTFAKNLLKNFIWKWIVLKYYIICKKKVFKISSCLCDKYIHMFPCDPIWLHLYLSLRFFRTVWCRASPTQDTVHTYICRCYN